MKQINIFFLIILLLYFEVVCCEIKSNSQWITNNNETNSNTNQMQNLLYFRDKVVLVTQSSLGIGKAIVSLFAQLGAKVVITGRNANAIKRTALQVRKVSPEKLKPLKINVDITNEADLKKLINKTISTFGKLDVLVNNVAVSEKTRIRTKDYMSNFDKIINTNLRSIVQTTHIAVPHLLETNGTIVNVAAPISLDPYSNRKHTLAYGAAKASLDSMTTVLAQELGPKIRVNTVCPGIIESELAQEDELVSLMKSRAETETPLKRLGRAIDVAKAVVFLASSDAMFITGVSLRIDGGYMFNSI